MLIEESISQVGVLKTSLMLEFNQKVRMDRRVSGGTITCSSGCAWCCYHPVTISIFEGITLYRWLVSHGKWTSKLRENLKKAADTQFGITPEVWLKALIPCVLLGPDNKCTAYAGRPLICQAYYAVSDPHYCHPHRLSKSLTTLVPRDQVVDTFHTKQAVLHHKHKLQVVTLPLGASLLMAEKICTEEVDLEALDGVILKEYGSKL